jgi:Mn2+/Fe2+ NRAMP family transporter
MRVMNESHNSSDENTVDSNKWLRLSRILLVIGLALVVGAALISVLIGAVSAFTGTIFITDSYAGLPAAPLIFAPLIFGILFLVAGIISWIVPHASGEEWLWISKTGPFIR